jgi:glucose-1-phosphatase
MDFSKDDVKVLLFDLGGVVLQISFARVLDAWSSYAGIESALLRTRFKLDDSYEQHECGLLTGSGYFAALRESLALHLTDEQFEAGWNAIAMGEVPGIRTMLLEARRRYPLYAFSNTNFTHLKYIAQHYNEVLGVFEKLFTSCELGKRKPTEEAFALVVEEIGVDAKEILFFDDLLENVEGARGAGLQAVHVKTVEDTKRVLEYLTARKA